MMVSPTRFKTRGQGTRERRAREVPRRCFAFNLWASLAPLVCGQLAAGHLNHDAPDLNGLLGLRNNCWRAVDWCFEYKSCCCCESSCHGTHAALKGLGWLWQRPIQVLQ